MNNTFFKKTLSITLATIFVSTPMVTFAQGIMNPTDTIIDNAAPRANVVTEGAPRAIPVTGNAYQPISLQNSQANAALYGASTTPAALDAAGMTGSFATCVGAGAISNAIKGAITNAISRVTNLFEAPVADNQQRAKDSGPTVFGTVSLPSWDQAGWCLVNSIIESVGAATVNWINSGFQGNPVFVDNPEQFFADVADIQAGAFLNEMSNGLFCTPIQDLVRINLANSYNSSISPYGQRSACTFSETAGSLEQFMSGETFSWDDWLSYTQNPYNNPFGATIYSQIELDQRIASALGTQSTLLEWGGGFFSKKDPETGKITSPGSIVQDQLNERLGSGQRRLEIADEFDEIVNALVNQLIRVALTEMTEASR